jgi:hypothetical protein
VISQCSNLKNKEERQKKKEADKSAGEASIIENSDGGEALMITFNDENRMAWILDSACSFHICSHREWFSDYSHVHDGDVIISDESFKIKGSNRPLNVIHKSLTLGRPST